MGGGFPKLKLLIQGIKTIERNLRMVRPGSGHIVGSRPEVATGRLPSTPFCAIPLLVLRTHPTHQKRLDPIVYHYVLQGAMIVPSIAQSCIAVALVIGFVQSHRLCIARSRSPVET